MVTRLVDNAIRPEEKEKEASSNSSGAERYTPSKETTTSAAGMWQTKGYIGVGVSDMTAWKNYWTQNASHAFLSPSLSIFWWSVYWSIFWIIFESQKRLWRRSRSQLISFSKSFCFTISSNCSLLTNKQDVVKVEQPVMSVRWWEYEKLIWLGWRHPKVVVADAP